MSGLCQLYCDILLSLRSNLILRVMNFGEECIYREYRDMQHGWTVRGDNRREDVNNAARAAFTSMLGFFSTHLK